MEQVVGLGDVDEAEVQAAARRLPPPEVNPGEEDALALAKAYFDVREYRRAAHLLGKCKKSLNISAAHRLSLSAILSSDSCSCAPSLLPVIYERHEATSPLLTCIHININIFERLSALVTDV